MAPLATFTGMVTASTCNGRTYGVWAVPSDEVGWALQTHAVNQQLTTSCHSTSHFPSVGAVCGGFMVILDGGDGMSRLDLRANGVRDLTVRRK